ncbi:MAG TPA: DUF721 domain-containing protein [Gemmatimonadaceae bacterium]|nr:DUF721 domain-containing protein [Gemmatimonadaceae bacterium]
MPAGGTGGRGSRRKGPPERVGDALSRYLERARLAERVEQARIIPEWEELVGEQIASVTRPLSIARDGTLFVAVRSHAWMSELSLMERQLLASLNVVSGRARVERIRWRLLPPEG